MVPNESTYSDSSIENVHGRHWPAESVFGLDFLLPQLPLLRLSGLFHRHLEYQGQPLEVKERKPRQFGAGLLHRTSPSPVSTASRRISRRIRCDFKFAFRTSLLHSIYAEQYPFVEC